MTGRQLIALSFLTVAALALRLIHLTRFELFVDEAATWWFAKLIAAGDLSEQMTLEPTPPLYYALIGVLTRLFGDGDLVLRLPSALFGAAAIPIVFTLGRALFGTRAGWIAAALLAIHPLHVFYSREARVYPLLLCLTLLTLLALWRALERDAWRRWATFGVALFLVCASHFYGLFLAAAAALAILLWGGGRTRRRGLIAVAAALLAFAPYLAMTLPHLEASGAAWSIDAFYRDFPREKQIGRVLETQLIGAGYHPYLRHLDQPPTPEPLRAASVLAQLALLVSALRFAAARGRLRQLGFVAVGWLVPILVPWAITHLGRAIFHAGRHDVYALGGLCVLLAVGLEGLCATGPARRWRGALAAAAVMAIVAGAAFRLAALHRVQPVNFDRNAGAWIADHAEPGDRVLAMGIRRLVTEHYARLGGSGVELESFPASTDDHPGWSDTMTLIDDQEALHREARDRIAALGASLSLRGGAPGSAGLGHEANPKDSVLGAMAPRMADGGTLFVLLRRYQRTEGAVSASWLVDRHVLENLWHAGWRRVPEDSSRASRIEAYRPPAPADENRSEARR